MKPFLLVTPFRKVVVILAVLSSFIASCKKDNGDSDTSDALKKAYVTTIAGLGAFGFQDGPAASAKFYHPYDNVVHSDGSLIVTDHSNFRVRKIKDGQVSTYAGNGNYGIGNGEGNIASFRDVSMVANDGSGTN